MEVPQTCVQASLSPRPATAAADAGAGGAVSLFASLRGTLPGPANPRAAPLPLPADLSRLVGVLENRWAPSTTYQRGSIWGQLSRFAAAHGLDIRQPSTPLLFLEAKMQQGASPEPGGLRALGSLGQYASSLRSLAPMFGLPWSEDPELLALQAAATGTADPTSAAPIPLDTLALLLRSLPRLPALLLAFLFRTASRLDEGRRLTPAMCFPFPPWLAIVWGRETKSSRLDPHCMRFTSILPLEPEAWELLLPLLRRGPDVPVFLPSVTAALLAALRPHGLKGHCLKHAAADASAAIIQTAGLSPAVLPLLLKHSASTDDAGLPRTTVRYLSEESRARFALSPDRKSLARGLMLLSRFPWAATPDEGPLH